MTVAAPLLLACFDVVLGALHDCRGSVGSGIWVPRLSARAAGFTPAAPLLGAGVVYGGWVWQALTGFGAYLMTSMGPGWPDVSVAGCGSSRLGRGARSAVGVADVSEVAGFIGSWVDWVGSLG